MTKTLKGITVQIGAETTGLSNALKDVNSESYKISKELREVNNLLKFNPKNTEALTQKQQLLGDEIATTRDKLKTLKASQDDVVAAFKRGEIAEEDYRSFKRELVKTESQLKKYKGELKDTNDQKNKFKTGLKNATTEMGKFGKKAGDVAKKGIKALAVGVGAVVGGMVALSESTREFRDDMSKLEQNAKTSGNSFGAMKRELSYLNAVTGETDSSIEALSNLMAIGFDDVEMFDVVNALAGAVVKFPDTLKIEGLADGLQETLATGQAIGPFSELIERMGGSVEDFNVQLAAATTEAEKQEVAMKWLAESGLADINEAYAENNLEAIRAKEAQFALDDALATLGGTIEPVTTKFKEGLVPIIQRLTDWVIEYMPVFQEIMDKAFSKASEVAGILWDWISENLWPVLQNMYGWVEENWPELQAIFETVFGVIWDVVSAVWKVFSEDLWPILKSLFSWVEENWPKFQENFEVVFNAISGAIEIAWGWMEDFIEVAKTAYDEAEKTIKKIKEFLEWDNQQRERGTGIGYTNASMSGAYVNPQWDRGLPDGTSGGGGGWGGATYNINNTINAKTTVDADEMDNIMKVNNSKMAYELGL